MGFLLGGTIVPRGSISENLRQSGHHQFSVLAYGFVWLAKVVTSFPSLQFVAVLGHKPQEKIDDIDLTVSPSR